MPEVSAWVAVVAFVLGYLLRGIALVGPVIDAARRFRKWLRPEPPDVRFASRGRSGTREWEDGERIWLSVQPSWTILNLGPGRVVNPRSGIEGPSGERRQHPIQPQLVAEENEFVFGATTDFAIPTEWLGKPAVADTPELAVAYFLDLTDANGRAWEGSFDPRIEGPEGSFTFRRARTSVGSDD